MLPRFCLYGFVKNQKYFEPFLFLAFLEKGLSFTQIGLLIGFREICINLLEVPTGAVADVLGRRKAMILSHLAYIGAFAIFGDAFAIFGLRSSLPLLFAAMFLFSIGEVFRTGTHKAIIFDWLQHEGRGDEKTRIYGFTRSWSKLGSALSAAIAAVLVFTSGEYSTVFLYCIVPYAINVVNFLTYPQYLDGPPSAHRGASDVGQALVGALRDAFKNRRLRRLLAESMGFEGLFRASKDYLQPILMAAAVSLPLLYSTNWTHPQRAAVLVGAVYVIMNLLGSFASRHSDALAKRAGGEAHGARWLWAVDLAVFAALGAGIVAGLPGLAIAAFVALAVVQNFWRPILISRVAQCAEASRMATVLSMESQCKTLFTAVAAPLLGLAVDIMPGQFKFLPIAALGVLIAAGMLMTSKRLSR